MLPERSDSRDPLELPEGTRRIKLRHWWDGTVRVDCYGSDDTHLNGYTWSVPLIGVHTPDVHGERYVLRDAPRED
jgi:hypothetical protein